jgi:hypothetical protein
MDQKTIMQAIRWKAQADAVKPWKDGDPRMECAHCDGCGDIFPFNLVGEHRAGCIPLRRLLMEHAATLLGGQLLAKDEIGTAAVKARAQANPILEYFEATQLPPHLRAVSEQFGDTARLMAGAFPASAELSAGLRKLLEAKDCFVRCAVTQSKRAAEAAAVPEALGATIATELERPTHHS